jgi:hypothetical protein
MLVVGGKEVATVYVQSGMSSTCMYVYNFSQQMHVIAYLRSLP